MYLKEQFQVFKWFRGRVVIVPWTTKLATRVRSTVAKGLSNDYSVLGGDLTWYCFQQYQPRLDNLVGIETYHGLCWRQVDPSIPGGDFRRLHTLNKRPLP